MQKWQRPSDTTLLDWATKVLKSKKLTAWEISFVTNLKGFIERGFKLSREQIEILEKIYAERI